MLTQSEYMRKFNETHREDFNDVFFQRSNQEIMDCTKKVILSCQRDKYFTIQVLKMREIYDYEEIYNLLRDHDEKRRKKNSKEDNAYDYININDSDIMLLEVNYLIRHNGIEKTKDESGEEVIVTNPWKILTIYIALPRFTKKYYFRLNGNYYSDIFQIVDGSTYNNITNGTKTKKSPCNTFKTIFTPVRMFRMYRDMVDFYSGETIRNTLYTTIIPIVFNINVNTMLYMICNFGFYNVQKFLDIICVRVDDKPIVDDKWYNFEKNGIYISYPKECAQDPMVQSFAATIYDGINANTTINNIFDTKYWIKVLGNAFGNNSIDKGLFVLDALDGIYDIITHEQLHLPEEEKSDIYHILRWLMREFSNIRKKNNIDVSIKRYRIGEPIASLLAKKLITSLSRITDLGRKVTLDRVEKHLYIKPMFIINQLLNNANGMTNLIAYRDMVNDNDALLALKYTYKGISGLGDSGTQIQQSYRYVDPSHAGIVDLDSSTTSDPGMSGTLCPLGKVYPGNSFSIYEEPNNWNDVYRHIQYDFMDKYYPKGKPLITYLNGEPPKEDICYNKRPEIEKPFCPFYNIKDPSIKYDSASYALRQEANNTINIQSIFTVGEDIDEDEINNVFEEGDYYE